MRPILPPRPVTPLVPQARQSCEPHRRWQRGTTLVEALIAFVVLSVGVLALSRGHGDLRRHADLARQRSEAVQFAQHDLEHLRAYATLDAASGVRSFAAIDSDVAQRDAANGDRVNVEYRLQRSIDAATFAHAKAASVRVEWNDRRGESQHIVLETLIAGADPALAAVLGLEPRARQITGVLGRSAAIPLEARDLGNGTSAFKPLETGQVALIFDNATGQLTQRCTGVSADVTNRQLSTTALSGCTTIPGYLLSGVVRFGPDVAAGSSPALAVELQLIGDGDSDDNGAAPSCSSEELKTVAYEVDGETRVIAVSLAANPGALGLETWRDLDEHHVTYFCVVPPRAGGRWSGRSAVRPIGWAIGTEIGEYRVCRFVADLDGSGAIDRNIEHPAIYDDVDGPLPQQNFLIMGAGASCPAVDSSTFPVDIDRATLQHQP